MRLLVLSQYFRPETFRINQVVDTLAMRGCDVTVLTGQPNYPGGKIFPGYTAWRASVSATDGSGTVVRVPLIPRSVIPKLGLALNYLSFVLSASVVGSWLVRRKKFDVIFVYAPSPILQALPALLIGWLKGCPVVLWIQDLWPQSLSATGHVKNRLILWLVEKVVRFIYRRCDLLLVQSRGFIGPVRALSGATPVKYFPNSADFSPASATGMPDITNLKEGFCVVFAGNIGSAQAVDVIVEAAALLRDRPEIQILVVGDGSLRPWMLEQQEARGLQNLLLPGRFQVETMPALMRRASVLLVTLKKDEIFAATIPSKVQAYLSAGRPVLACLDGEGAKLIQDAGAGLTVPAQDAAGLAKAILQLYQMTPRELDTLGENGQKYFMTHFEHNKLMDELLAILNSPSTQGSDA